MSTPPLVHCWHCGGALPAATDHFPEDCIRVLRQRIEKLEERPLPTREPLTTRRFK